LTVAAAQAVVSDGALDRCYDVVASMAAVATVVRSLAARNARLVARLTVEARIDPLTGLLNRRGLDERFAGELARSVRDRRALAVVAIDIDHFKRVNDEHGHQAGDRALVWLASMLCEQTRGGDIVARVGGEEFVIVLPGADGPSSLEVAQRRRGLRARAEHSRHAARRRRPRALRGQARRTQPGQLHPFLEVRPPRMASHYSPIVLSS
jgi:diguanylate cyclase (GGDEF)-like protein